MHLVEEPTNFAVDNGASEIKDLNLSYLLLAQKMVHQNRSSAMLKLGISGEFADFLKTLSTHQIIKIAQSSFLLCGRRMDELPCMTEVMREGRDPSLQQAHLAILVASRHNELAGAA